MSFISVRVRGVSTLTIRGLLVNYLFIKKNLNIKPSKGSVVVFKNCIGNTNKKDVDSIHAALPVIKGEKWVFNLWFREAPTNKIMYQDIKINNIFTKVL